MDGYILGAKRPDMLPLDEKVRCVLTFADGTGFAAFSELDEYQVGWLASLGAGTPASKLPTPPVQPLPGLPLPLEPDGLKNVVCRANTVLAQYLGWSEQRWRAICRRSDVQGAAWTDLGLLVVEFGADLTWPDPVEGFVRADAVTWARDIRLVTV